MNKLTSHNKKTLVIIFVSFVAVALLTALSIGLIVFNQKGRKEKIEGLSGEQAKWLKGYRPKSMSDTPPGFNSWPTNNQCSWQVKYFPSVRDGYCGPFMIDEDEEKNKACDDFCQEVTARKD